METAVLYIALTNSTSYFIHRMCLFSDILGILSCLPSLVVCFNNKSSFMSKMLK
jgi:hypothetical protein